MNNYLFEDIVMGKEGLLKGPFGSDLKKELYVPKGVNTYKVYLQENILKKDNNVGKHYISKEYFDQKMFRYKVKENDFIVTCDGTLGEIFQLKNIVERGIISSSLLRITLNNEIVDDNYFYYLFKVLIKKELITQGNNSVLKHLPGVNLIRKHPIKLPNLNKQKYIGSILKIIDEKIFNNNKINLELEIMAKTIYDYWFLQFEFPNKEGKPYRSSGGKLVWNEELKREIPEKWNVGNLYDIAEFINGLPCQKFRPISNKHRLPVIKIKEMHNGFRETTEWVREDIPEKNIIDNGDILFSWSATLETMIWNGGKGALNQHIFKVIPKNYHRNYVYMQLARYIINFIKIAEARKTTMGHITTDHLKQSKVIIPPIEIANNFSRLINMWFERIKLLSIENQELTSLREFILPLLMNEQIDFKDN